MWQAEILPPELSVPVYSFWIEIATQRMKGFNSRGIDQIPAELIQAEVETLLYVVHKLIHSLSNKESP
jgi:hypothetical protein